ncbi:helix-turn-helix domain-containing protein [Curtobacterium ammoniigenes]|uniref:helix-turn-helix domain-containing protein n=1 Tax=Curtobacterium ammoniigenes TaxID=395387 RepID=UPI0008327A87|nr:helix-turn-helix domain-containing protein [Curtobacterium ammoniigenes]
MTAFPRAHADDCTQPMGSSERASLLDPQAQHQEQPAHDRVVGVREDYVRAETLQSSDIEIAELTYRHQFHARRIRFEPAKDRPFEFRFRIVGDDRLSLRTIEVNAARSGIISPSRQYMFGWSPEGGVRMSTGCNEATVMLPGIPTAYPSTIGFELLAPPGLTHAIHVNADYLEAVAGSRVGHPVTGIAFLGPNGDDHFTALRCALSGVAPRLSSPTTDPLDRQALDRTLADRILDAFAWTPSADAEVVGTPLDRAKVFLHLNCTRSIAVAEVAAVAGISVRTLQQTFLSHEQTTPLSYLRTIRLQKVRWALRLAGPTTSVRDTASAWGFNHMGRFSGAYFETFGEHPSETLRAQQRHNILADSTTFI